MIKAFVIALLICLAGFTQASYAAISLSVNPVDGTSALRFEALPATALENKKEIRIRITSTNGNRYQVFQRVLEPISDEKGNPLNLQAVEAQTQSNSNSYGTLYEQNSTTLGMGDQLLYSSSQNGDSDAFIIGYSLNQNLISAGSRFRGILVFEVRGLGNDSSDQANVDVFIDTTNASISAMNVVVKGGHLPTGVHIKGTDTTEKAADYINFSFSGNSGQDIRIYQVLDNMPQDQADDELGSNVLQLDAEGAAEGLRNQGISVLSTGRTLIYSSNKSEDNFVIYFLVDPNQVQQQAAGSYMGRIKYVVETSQGSQEFPINIECDIQPVFALNITPPAGGIAFSHVLANNPPQDKLVMVTVQSNLHKPYQVLQNMQTNMTNQEGKQFDNKYFTIQVQIPSGQKGQTNYVEFTPAQTGEYPIYTSDAQGDGATFEVDYRLEGYAQMYPGDFSTPITLSLNQK